VYNGRAGHAVLCGVVGEEQKDGLHAAVDVWLLREGPLGEDRVNVLLVAGRSY
jgi:hypothetical protein